ncbi:MAG: hypothetical protein HQL36_05400 [Alphaproteobacteria bacterium]|nr:hypothetical protein [Alphaproteobacteria bacterium]
MKIFVPGLEIPGLSYRVEDVVSGGLFDRKSSNRCLVLEIAFNQHTMRMLTSVSVMGKAVSIFSYESFSPTPSSLDLENGSNTIVEAIAASLSHMEDVEFFLTMDQVFNFVHDSGVELIRNCSLSTVHVTSVRMGRLLALP